MKATVPKPSRTPATRLRPARDAWSVVGAVTEATYPERSRSGPALRRARLQGGSPGARLSVARDASRVAPLALGASGGTLLAPGRSPAGHPGGHPGGARNGPVAAGSQTAYQADVAPGSAPSGSSGSLETNSAPSRTAS